VGENDGGRCGRYTGQIVMLSHPDAAVAQRLGMLRASSSAARRSDP
jgi:hypothetical protein